MDGISFGLAIVAEARTLVTSIRNRIQNYANGPATFQSLSESVDRLARHIAEVEKLLRKFPDAVPPDTATIFLETFAAVRDSLRDVNRTMEQSVSKAFAPSGSSIMGRLKTKARRTLRATALSSSMNAMETKVEKASNHLLQLTLALGNALSMKQHHDAILPKLENLAIGETPSGVYCARIDAPALNDTINLEFDSKDEAGKPATPEGHLKQSVLSSDSSSAVTAAAGVMHSAYGIVGMAGVGKTVALQGLASDKDVRLRFPDGILFMTLGQGASLETVLRGLASILARTGAVAIVKSVQASTSLREAVDSAVPWFQGRICLFLVDDVWPSRNCRTGFLPDLRQILRESPKSRMVISTRSTAVAQCAGSVVSFGARNPTGPVSTKIFMAHATSGTSRNGPVEHCGKLGGSVLKILSICGGLPIALAVSGCAVALLTSAHGGFESACEAYAVRLEKKRNGLGDEDTMEGMSLNAGILLSLECLEGEFLKWKAKGNVTVGHSALELYTSLCVLERQAWAPISVLRRLWGLDEDAAIDVENHFCGMSLATLHLRQLSEESSEEAGIVLHDLQLDFCKQQALEKKTFSRWHSQMLNGYLETSGQSTSEAPNSDLAQNIVNCTPRPWWSPAVPEDGYIHANLSRHLFCAGLGIELAALLLCPEWTELRSRIGGILGLKTDFELVGKYFAQLDCTRHEETLAVEVRRPVEQKVRAVRFSWMRRKLGRRTPHLALPKKRAVFTGEVRRSFEQIVKAVQLSWGRKAKGMRVFHFLVCGRLLSLRNSSAVVEAYIRRSEALTPKPYLRYVSPRFPDVSGGMVMEIPVGGNCRSILCLPCGEYIAAGAGDDIVIVETRTGEILQRLQGHERCVSCLAFCTRSTTIASGGMDGNVMVWDWEKLDSPLHVLEGHEGDVTGVAISSDGKQIFSSSQNGTLRIWDTTTGTQAEELNLSTGINCLAMCVESRKIALSLNDGTLKVLDSVTRDVLFEYADIDEDWEWPFDSVSFSPNGPYLAAGTSFSKLYALDASLPADVRSCMQSIQLWNTHTWTKESGYLQEHTGGATCVSFSADGTQIATSSCDGMIRACNIASEEISTQMSPSSTPVAFTADGSKIVSGSCDGIIHIWDARLDTESKGQSYGHTDAVRGVTISQDGLRVASASADGTVQLWDSQTGEKIGVPLEGHTGCVNCVSFSLDGRRLASGSSDKTVMLWSGETFTPIGYRFKGHTDEVQCVSFSSDGLRIISGSQHGEVLLWNVETRDLIGDFWQYDEGCVSCVSESPDGCYILCSTKRTVIYYRHNMAKVWESEETDEIDDDALLKELEEIEANEDAIERNGLERNGKFEIEIGDEERKGKFMNEIGDEEAKKIILSCGERTPRLWPSTFPMYTAEVYCEDDSVYSNLLLIAITMSKPCWAYHEQRKVFAFGLQSGAVAICKFITE